MKIGVENKGASPMYVAGVMIPGGETRHFDEAELPPELRPGAQPADELPPPDPLGEILQRSVRDILAGLDALSDDDIDALIDREEATKQPRKTLLAGLAEAQLLRAAARMDPASQGEGGDGEGGDTGTGEPGAEEGAAGKGADNPGGEGA